MPRALTDPMVEQLRAECAADEIPFIDATAAMRRRSGQGPALFFPRDPHPTPAGYEALAEEIGTFLLEQRLIR
jgi:hypothetical protein